MNKITLFPIKTPLIERGDSIAELLYKSIIAEGLNLQDGDVLVIAETPVAVAEGRLLKLEDVKPSEKAKKLALEYEMDPKIVEIILNEADELIGGVRGVLLTKKFSILIANAGVDLSNAPPGYVVLFPENPYRSAQIIRAFLMEKTKKQIGVILGDSRVQPLRRGTIGVAIGVAGINPVEDVRGRKDLYGRELQLTFRAIADNLVSAAQLLMGEANEQIPAVLIRGAPIQLSEKSALSMEIAKNECLFMNSFLNE